MDEKVVNQNASNVVSIVFNSFEGSVSHYYHFLYGALIPLIEYHLENPDKKLLITTNVGPFQQTLLELFTPEVIVGFEDPVIPPGETYFDDKSMNWVRVKRQGEVILPAYDVFNTSIIRNRDKSQRNLEQLLSIRPEILRFIEDRIPEEYRNIETFEIVLLERATDPYYIEKSKTNQDKGRAIFYTSGKQRRDITNQQELIAGLKTEFPDKVGNVILEGKSMFYQIQIFKNASIVIGQHGAGLANAFFMKPDANMIEVMSPWGRKGDHFRNLADRLRINYYKFDLNEDVGPVDVPTIINIVNNIYSRTSGKRDTWRRDDTNRDSRRNTGDNWRRDDRRDTDRRDDTNRDSRRDTGNNWRRDTDRRDDRRDTFSRNTSRWGGKTKRKNSKKQRRKLKKKTKKHYKK
jgi:hypothetical protein